MLQFHDVRDAAAEFLESHLNASNCLGMMLLSDAHQCKRLYELSWRMCLLHYQTVMLCTCVHRRRPGVPHGRRGARSPRVPRIGCSISIKGVRDVRREPLRRRRHLVSWLVDGSDVHVSLSCS